MSDVLLYQTPRSAWLKASAAAVRRYDPIRADIWLWYADLIDRGRAMPVAVAGNVPMDGEKLEAALRAAGYDPNAQECWFYWDFWQQRGLAATLHLIQTAERPPRAAGYIDHASASQNSPQRRDGV